MKTKLFILFLIIFLVSCKNNSENKIIISEEDTIKRMVLNKESSVTWSKELEPDKLSQPIKIKNLPISKEVEYNIDILKVLNNYQNPIYPEFENFGSLDSSNLSLSLKEKINNFCEKLSKGSFQEIKVAFHSDYIFNYVFFTNDFKKYCKENLKIDNPEELQENETIFTKWIIGEPFIGKEILQLPVRFYCNEGTLDITLYMNIQKEYLIYQITIDRWEKYDGKK